MGAPSKIVGIWEDWKDISEILIKQGGLDERSQMKFNVNDAKVIHIKNNFGILHYVTTSYCFWNLHGVEIAMLARPFKWFKEERQLPMLYDIKIHYCRDKDRNIF